MSRIVVETVCNTLYGHKIFQTKDEVIQNDPSMEKYKIIGPKPSKRVKSAENSEVPISVEDYAVYENVAPSLRVLSYHKHVLATQHEKEGATASSQIGYGIKVALHFDPTSRSRIQINWPCLILIFSDKR